MVSMVTLTHQRNTRHMICSNDILIMSAFSPKRSASTSALLCHSLSLL